MVDGGNLTLIALMVVRFLLSSVFLLFLLCFGFGFPFVSFLTLYWLLFRNAAKGGCT